MHDGRCKQQREETLSYSMIEIMIYEHSWAWSYIKEENDNRKD